MENRFDTENYKKKICLPRILIGSNTFESDGNGSKNPFSSIWHVKVIGHLEIRLRINAAGRHDALNNLWEHFILATLKR